MRARDRAVLAALVATACGVAGVAACNQSSSPAPLVDDGGTSSDAGIDVTLSAEDSALPVVIDAADSAAPPIPVHDAAFPLVGKCEPVQGPACDLVLQQCPEDDAGVQQQCYADLLADGGYTTQCLPVTTAQHLQKGHGCCPAAAGNPCDFGLECIGDPNMSCDAGALPGRCTPHCCGGDAGDDSVCGTSVPEGYPGHCNTLVVDSNDTPLYNACTYELACKPFQLQPCPSGLVCEIEDPTGTAGCSTIYTTDGGAPPTENQPCVALNNCADGLVCIGSGAGDTCLMMCLTPGTTPPFDAGALGGGPFQGGCPANEECTVVVGGFPVWISFCGP